MKSSAPPIFPIFRSQLQADLLVLLLLGDVEESVTNLAAAVRGDVGNTHREIERLERAGITVSRRVGRTRLVQANRNAPFYRSLSELVMATMGPAYVLARELVDLDGVESASIFGSWAARMAGEEGPAPNDIDLLVIGTPDRDDLYERARAASTMLGRDVNPVVISPRRWHDAPDGFARELASRPRVPVISRREGAEHA